MSKPNQKDEGRRAQDAVLTYLIKHPQITKKQLLAGASELLGLTGAEKNDHAPGGRLALLHAAAGQALVDLMASGRVQRCALRYSVTSKGEENAPKTAQKQKKPEPKPSAQKQKQRSPRTTLPEAADGKSAKADVSRRRALKAELSGSEEDRRSEEAILRYLRSHAVATRKELLEGALASFDLNETEKRDEAPRSRKSLLRNSICRAMRGLTQRGVLKKEQLRYSFADVDHGKAAGKNKDTSAKKPAANVEKGRAQKTEQIKEKPVKKQDTAKQTASLTKQQEGMIARKAVLDYLRQHPGSAKQEVLAGAILLCGLSEAQLKDDSNESPSVRLRSRMGQVISQLLASGEAVKRGHLLSLAGQTGGSSHAAKQTFAAGSTAPKQAKKEQPSQMIDADRASEAVIGYLKGHPGASRKEILSGALAALGLSEEELRSHQPNGCFARLGSTVGSALAELIAQGSVRKQNGEHRLVGKSSASTSEETCEREIRRLLQMKKYRRKDLLKALGGMEKPMAERVLDRLIAGGEVVNGDGGVLCTVSPLTSQRVLGEAECKRELLHQIVARDGKFFEQFLAKALERYFKNTGRRVTHCSIPGGSADGGIDVEIDTVDEPGFSEHILVQAKGRETLHVTEKEVREFYGALHAQRGSRGIYVTTSTFHPAAQKLLDSLNNCVGIDGDKLFEILKKTEYGVKTQKNGYTVDPTVF